MDRRIAAITADADASVVLVTERTLALLADSGKRYPALGNRRWIAVETCEFVALRLRWALSETRLVLMIWVMESFLVGFDFRQVISG